MRYQPIDTVVAQLRASLQDLKHVEAVTYNDRWRSQLTVKVKGISSSHIEIDVGSPRSMSCRYDKQPLARQVVVKTWNVGQTAARVFKAKDDGSLNLDGVKRAVEAGVEDCREAEERRKSNRKAQLVCDELKAQAVEILKSGGVDIEYGRAYHNVAFAGQQVTIEMGNTGNCRVEVPCLTAEQVLVLLQLLGNVEAAKS